MSDRALKPTTVTRLVHQSINFTEKFRCDAGRSTPKIGNSQSETVESPSRIPIPPTSKPCRRSSSHFRSCSVSAFLSRRSPLQPKSPSRSKGSDNRTRAGSHRPRCDSIPTTIALNEPNTFGKTSRRDDGRLTCPRAFMNWKCPAISAADQCSVVPPRSCHRGIPRKRSGSAFAGIGINQDRFSSSPNRSLTFTANTSPSPHRQRAETAPKSICTNSSTVTKSCNERPTAKALRKRTSAGD